MLQKLGRYYPPQLEIIPLLLLIFTFYLVFTNYANLPERIPTHFDIRGAVDGWGGKSEILIFPIVGGFAYLLFTGVGIAFTLVRDPKSLINMPEKTKAAITPQAAEKLRVVMVRSLLALKSVVLGMMTYLAYFTIQVALGRAQGLGVIWFPLFLIGLLVIVGNLLYQIFRLANSKSSHT
jgi:uncharacterized membrane protein